MFSGISSPFDLPTSFRFINPYVQSYLVYYLEACACIGKVPDDLETYLPWNLPEAVRETLKLRVPSDERDDSLWTDL